MPRFEAIDFEITEPTNASVIATFNDAKKYGIARGSPTLMNVSRGLAPSERSTSSISGSTVARPVATLTAIGKKLIRNAVSTAGMVPMPNQMTRTGTMATFGTELKPTSIG